MSEIDIQNAKQIRDPMQVLIQMTIREYMSMTYSGYSGTAKIADGRLNSQWKMRKLADLQGDGFALDGTSVLYDSSVTPSYAAGKIGVRGHVGQTVSVTVSGSSQIKLLTLAVTGAGSVTYNGTTSAIAGGRAIIQINSASATLTFNPTDSTHRVEVDLAQPGLILRVTNETLISATVSLRSDLSPYGQTLPESELNVEVYNDADISESIVNISDDTPIYYSAGYAGDMTTNREFYVSGQVTWKDNVLSIHAVDAVHFLDDITIEAPVTELDSDYFLNSTRWLLERADIDYDSYYFSTSWWSNANRWIIREGTKARDYIAFMAQTFNLTDVDGNFLDGSGSCYSPIQFAFVDAGWPQVRTQRNTGVALRHIDESDCADLARDAEKPVGRVDYQWDKILDTSFGGMIYRKCMPIGKATWTKGIGASLNFEKYAFAWMLGVDTGNAWDNENAQKIMEHFGTSSDRGWPFVAPSEEGLTVVAGNYSLPRITNPYTVGYKLAKGSIPQEAFLDTDHDTTQNGYKIYSSFVPWSVHYDAPEWEPVPTYSCADSWNKMQGANLIASGTDVVDLDIVGNAFETDTMNYYEYRSSTGARIQIDELPVIGQVSVKNSSSNPVRVFPEKMVAAGMYRSNITGSFKWKGDPRMQPRDIVYFDRLDGTTETITLENITLHHEGGGTWADITYRKGAI